MLPLTALLLLQAMLVSWSSAASRPAPLTGFVECDPVEKYTVEWFRQNTKKQFRDRPFSSNALFYSRDMSSAARALAKDQKKVTIWDIWPCYLYNHDRVQSNPMRCIHNSDEQRQTFFENMSLAFAQKARESATVLHSYHHYNKPPVDGIWATVELPELTKGNGPVNWLQKLKMHSAWPRGSVEKSPTEKSWAEEQWLRSNAGLEWMRLLREDISSWSEIFWQRMEPKQLSHWDSLELKRDLGRVKGVDDFDEVEEDSSCITEESLEYFDNNVTW
ncbi:hypothetical protein F5Y15DRAFT_365818 [Xylariaceae sp. FL0016]|nr:hypothetical protein F5Y15DRAFT_365818 [Xylariaceae sp. FL0016]